MPAETIVLLLGAILILASAIGGGFEAKELKIPKIGIGSRIISGVLGIALIILGIGLTDTSSNSDSETKIATSPSAETIATDGSSGKQNELPSDPTPNDAQQISESVDSQHSNTVEAEPTIDESVKN